MIVGGGVAGLTAGIYATRYGLDLVLLSIGAPGGQTAAAASRTSRLSRGITGAELMRRLTEQATNFGVRFESAEVKEIMAENGRWRLRCAERDYLAVAVILAMGASPRRLKIPGERDLFGRGVSYCATCDGFFYRGLTVAVIGGGNTALEEALYLADIARKVYVIHRRDELRADKLLAERARANEKIEFIWDTVPTQIWAGCCDRPGSLTSRLSGIASAGGRVFVAVDYRPNTEWLGDLEQGRIHRHRYTCAPASQASSRRRCATRPAPGSQRWRRRDRGHPARTKCSPSGAGPVPPNCRHAPQQLPSAPTRIEVECDGQAGSDRYAGFCWGCSPGSAISLTTRRGTGCREDLELSAASVKALKWTGTADQRLAQQHRADPGQPLRRQDITASGHCAPIWSTPSAAPTAHLRDLQLPRPPSRMRRR